MLIRIFVDTNCLYVNDNAICKNPTNFGIFNKIRKVLGSDQVKKITRMYISETVKKEFVYNSKEKFLEQKANVEKQNEALKKIFGDNLITSSKIKWESGDEFEEYLTKEIRNFIDENDDIYECHIPKNLDRLFERAFNKKPLFHEADKNGKTYYDAGLKDNLLVEEVESSLDLNDIGIIITKDNDFNGVKDIYPNISITKIEDLEETLNNAYPKYKLYKILNELNKPDTLRNLNDAYSLDIRNINNFKFSAFDDNFCEYIEEENAMKLHIQSKENNKKRYFEIYYDLAANEVLNLEEKYDGFDK